MKGPAGAVGEDGTPHEPEHAARRVGTARLGASGCRSHLLACLQRRIADREDAADALGDVLLVAWRRRSRLPGDPHEARLWLYGIAANTILNHRRGQRRLSHAVDRLRADIRALPPAAEPTGHDALDVRAAVLALPAGERELAQLVHWDGMSIADAAAVVGVNASTARSRYAKARRRLRAALGADEA